MIKNGRVLAYLLSTSLLLSSQPGEAQKRYSGVRALQNNQLNVFSQQSTSLATVAAPLSACTPRGYSFNFFNGVKTSPGQAQRASQEQKLAYGVVAPNGERIKYEVFYNQTGGEGSLQDFFETFVQRMQQQDEVLRDRYELFWEALNGRGSMIERVITIIPSYASFIDSFNQYQQSALIGALSSLANTAPTAADYVEHQTRLDNQILEGRKIILFAHSQGNLFMVKAFDYAKPKIGEASLRAIHVASAAPSVRGPWILADADLVINGLRLVGSVPGVTDSIEGYGLRPAGLNGEKDFLGHGLLEIYMNPSIPTSGRIRGYIQSAFSSLETPAANGQAGLFTATLTWNGAGDADLHTFEPNSAHVYYGAPRGTTGFLDVDNTTANGPEHYYAACDVDKIQLGNYRVGVNNYSGAEGRTAVIQISSRDGALATRSVVLGAAQGSSGNGSPSILVNVKVAKDEETGEYLITTS